MSDRIPGSSWDNPLMYRGYRIFVGEGYTRWDAYQYQHEDYDGPEDNRAGYAESVDACKAEIDERDSDQAAAAEEADDLRRDNPLEPDFRRLGQ